VSELDRLVPLGATLAGASVGVCVADARLPDQPLVYVNRAFEQLTGYPAAEVLGRNCRFLQGPDTEREAVLALRDAVAAGGECRVTLLNRRRDGTPFWNELLVVPVRDDAGAVTHFLGLQTDVSRTVGVVEALQAELDELRSLREVLTPPAPLSRTGLELASRFVPAEEVGGDFYLVAPGARGATVLAVGDASGHGVGAARAASAVRASIAAFSALTDDPLRLLQLANASLIERTGFEERYVTAACVTVGPGARDVRFASAGHPPPLVLDSATSLAPPRVALPLGVDLELGGAPGEARLGAGSGLLLHTDGLTEAREPDTTGERFGLERVQAALRERAGATPETLVDELATSAARFAGGRLADDLCLLAVRGSG
jgi:sigma-B regulation protein RsbU (phosphoserine phosphatase)